MYIYVYIYVYRANPKFRTESQSINQINRGSNQNSSLTQIQLGSSIN